MNHRLIVFLLLFTSTLWAQGNVYIVMGSDTGIWEGLNVSQYLHNYNPGLYTDPSRNAYRVMDPIYRNQMIDSYGTPLKMTWWMMSGNTFRYSENINVPEPNSITFYLMKKYHGEHIKQFGDEISLHYHTWVWTDYDKDGKYWWNQALSFEEFFDDFKYTLAQNLIDENVFPVSYRSGWHYMGNPWQNYLENILPFSMHNDYPGKHTDEVEPLDNLYDWSLAPSEFVPYHPDENNYQIPGNLNGYDLRSVYMTRVTPELMADVFKKAEEGVDQVVCIWAHLPESDFPEKIENVHKVMQATDIQFPNTKFRYCSAVEAMQRWLVTSDETPPEISINEELFGNELYIYTQINEPIFQNYPFVAVKDIYKNYKILPMISIGENRWRTADPVDVEYLVKVGIAATDKSGNLSTKFIRYLPDEKFIDNYDGGYTELGGEWLTSENRVWHKDSRIAKIPKNDSAKAEWTFSVDQSVKYSMFFQIPGIELPASKVKIELYNSSTKHFSETFEKTFPYSEWNYITSADLEASAEYKLVFTAYNQSEDFQNFASDVIKITPIIREKEISPDIKQLDFGSVSQIDTINQIIKIHNYGINQLNINSIYSLSDKIKVQADLPMKVEGMGSITFEIDFHSSEIGLAVDTLFIISDDPVSPVYKIPVTASIETPFFIIDNEDTENYYEFGEWKTSVAQAYGPTSRYSYLNQTPKNYADFCFTAYYKGDYNIQFIVPKTVNSSDNAIYYLIVNDAAIDSVFVDQNLDSGDWVNLFNSYFYKNDEVTIRVKDTGTSTTGPVLRADAVKFKALDNVLGAKDESISAAVETFELRQNYPNPFNPSTAIIYSIKENGPVKLEVFDCLGRLVITLFDGYQNKGFHELTFVGNNLPSGIYYYRLMQSEQSITKKMILLK